MKKKQDFARYTTARKIEKENVLIAQFLESARASYGRDELRKKYERNRHAYNIFSNKTPHTALHLGLVKTAKERMERRNRLAAQQYNSLSTGSPSRKSRPRSAPSINRYDRQMLKEVDKIRDIHDFYDFKEIDKQLRNRGGDWDPSTNDNLLNSERNRVVNRNATAYSSKASAGRASVEYLKDVRDITEVLKEQEQKQKRREMEIKSSKAQREVAPGRVDLLDVQPKKISRPKSANNLRPAPLQSTLSAAVPQGSIENSPAMSPIETGTPTRAQGADSMQKLALMRKNVSFKEFEALGEDEKNVMPLNRQSSMDSADDKGGLRRERMAKPPLAKSVSAISDLDMDDDPAMTCAMRRSESVEEFARRKSIILDVHFEEDPKTGLPHPRTHSHSAEGLEVMIAQSEISEADRLLHALRTQFVSQFHLPVRCRVLDHPFYIPWNDPEVPIAGVQLTFYDVGYFLPGNDDYEKYQAMMMETLREQEQQEEELSNPLMTAEMIQAAQLRRSSFTMRSSLLGDDRTKKRSPLSQGPPSPSLREVQGLSLPTSTGLLIVASDANPQSSIPPTYLFLTLSQLLQSPLCTYTDSLPQVVISEMLSFAYSFGADCPVTTPRDANGLVISPHEALERVVVDQGWSKALVVPCLQDMMDNEVTQGFIHAICDRLDVHWDSQIQRLALTL